MIKSPTGLRGGPCNSRSRELHGQFDRVQRYTISAVLYNYVISLRYYAIDSVSLYESYRSVRRYMIETVDRFVRLTSASRDRFAGGQWRVRGPSPSGVISIFAAHARGHVYIFLQAQRSFFSRDIIVTRDGTKDRGDGRGTRTHAHAHARMGEGRKVIRISLLFPDSVRCTAREAHTFHLCRCTGSRRHAVVSVACLY